MTGMRSTARSRQRMSVMDTGPEDFRAPPPEPSSLRGDTLTHLIQFRLQTAVARLSRAPLHPLFSYAQRCCDKT